jgi:hypothetical protein
MVQRNDPQQLLSLPGQLNLAVTILSSSSSRVCGRSSNHRTSGLAAESMPLTPEKFDEFIKREIESNAALATAAGITPNR